MLAKPGRGLARFGMGSRFVIIEFGRPCKVGGYPAILPPPIVLLKASSSRRLVPENPRNLSPDRSPSSTPRFLFLSMPSAYSLFSHSLHFPQFYAPFHFPFALLALLFNSFLSRTYVPVQNAPTFEQGKGVEPTRVSNSRAHVKKKKKKRDGMIRHIM